MFILILLMMITVFSIATYVVVCIELKRLYDLIKIMSEKQIELTSKGIAISNVQRKWSVMVFGAIGAIMAL